MGKNTAVNQMEELFNQTESIREQYAVALENAEAEVIDLTESIAEGESHVQDMYKHYVLNIVSLDAYQSEKKLLDDKKAILHVAEQKIADIAELMKGELYDVYREMKAIGNDFSTENSKNKAEQRQLMFQAKVDYLNAIHAGKKEVTKTNKYNKMIDRLRVEIGDKNDYSYDFGDSAVNALLHNDYNNTAGLDVQRDEIKSAYHSGSISGNVQKEANK